MKKTIIALMAPAGVAAADLSAADADTWLDNHLLDIYTADDSFTQNFSIISTVDEGTNDGDFSPVGGAATITYVSGGQSVLEIYSANKSVMEKVVFESGTLTLNANDLSFNRVLGSISNATFSTGGKTYTVGVAVPEPTTATLSMLALAGLADHR